MNPRCRAQTRAGKPCQRYPCKNGKCRFHGGRSTGPKTAEGRRSQRLAVTKHGMYSKQAIEDRRKMRQFINEAKEVLKAVE